MNIAFFTFLKSLFITIEQQTANDASNEVDLIPLGYKWCTKVSTSTKHLVE